MDDRARVDPQPVELLVHVLERPSPAASTLSCPGDQAMHFPLYFREDSSESRVNSSLGIP